jgi:ABC-type transport system involved in multi-copper enzyme maturation permease subunit
MPVIVRSGWVRRSLSGFFGPVFFYDLVRTARRGQQIAHRCLYAGLLTVMLLLVYWSWFPSAGFGAILRPVNIRISDLSQFSESFFHWFLIVQFGVVLLVTPAYTAGAIAEEKQRRTFEHLLATDLSNREIVLGLMAARLGNLFLLILTGLPIFGFLQFLGGVDPNMVFAGYLATAALTLSVGSLSILVSVYARTPFTAVVTAYFWIVLVIVGSVACTGTFWSALSGLVKPQNAGVPLGSRMSDPRLGFLITFSVFQVIWILIFCRRAISHVRKVAMGSPPPPARMRLAAEISKHLATLEFERPKLRVVLRSLDEGWGPYPETVPGGPDAATAGSAEPSAGSGLNNAEVPGEMTGTHLPANPIADVRQGLPDFRPPKNWPPVGNDALLWKEIYVEQRLTPTDPTVFFTCLAGLFFFLLIMVFLSLAMESRGELGKHINGWIRGAGIVLSLVTFLIIALNAAGKVTRERERQTLESLLILPACWEEILFAKWVGSLMSVRWFWWGLGALWGMGVVTGGLDPFAVPLLAAAWFVYAAFLATVGLWFSVTCRSTLRAVLFTILSGLAVVAGPALYLHDPGLTPATMGPDVAGWVAFFGVQSLSPINSLSALAFHSEDVTTAAAMLTWHKIVAAVAGLYGYMALTGLAWLSARARFRAER